LQFRLLTKIFVASDIESSAVGFIKISKYITRLEADAVIAVVDGRISDDNIVAAVNIPAICVLCLVLGSGDGRNADVSVSDVLALVNLEAERVLTVYLNMMI
jgi:hypothetical protein